MPVKVRTEPGGEGGPYKVYTIATREGVRVELQFEGDGGLYGADTESTNAVAQKGIGVGSTLAEVKRAWPNGEFMFGFADGRYVTFVTGTNVLFRFNPDDLPPGAFDAERPWDFPVPHTIKVKTISVYPTPNPVSKALPPIDENKTGFTEETQADHRIISRLEVERAPGSPLVRLVWTHEGKVEADRVIDVSGYPDFDIWTRDRVWHPSQVIISFRYGRFKNCAVRGEDRERVFVTLNHQSAILSFRPPEGAKLDDRWPLPKSVGNLMNSAAHGCRRTYDPKLGTFGLEKAE